MSTPYSLKRIRLSKVIFLDAMKEGWSPSYCVGCTRMEYNSFMKAFKNDMDIRNAINDYKAVQKIKPKSFN